MIGMKLLGEQNQERRFKMETTLGEIEELENELIERYEKLKELKNILSQINSSETKAKIKIITTEFVPSLIKYKRKIKVEPDTFANILYRAIDYEKDKIDRCVDEIIELKGKLK